MPQHPQCREAYGALMYECVVVGVDGSPTAFEAAKAAARLAEQCGATLHLVTAYRPVSALMSNPEFATIAAAAYEHLDPEGGAAEVTRKTAEVLQLTTKVEEHQVPGGAADALCDVAERVGADVIVVGSRGMTGARRMLGSVPNSVAHNSPCSVLIVRTG